MYRDLVGGAFMSDRAESDATVVAERYLQCSGAIDIPIPSAELRASIMDDDVVHVEDIARQAGHYSTGYRRC
jgi:hypothetical protein